ncbi:PGPGW domain-containing protein [Planctobacterium marinum]|uniref:PGPGW domain-containing protein n=1 Tax=Planctobacterium marinum TaxID=1631968 RepID=UPI001E4CB6AD|nr:PGPGW domain-containing protein [Planctobacterium marinum]MCC2604577.1 tellurium resistance protein TerC [Planctobacterium marinum]
MLNKPIRITLGSIGVFIGIVFAILPGSILFLVAGLFLLSFDFPLARQWLRKSQKMMSWGARKLDKAIYSRR